RCIARPNSPTFGQPARESLVPQTRLVDLLPAAVRHAAGPLQEKQTRLRRREEHAAAAGFLRDRGVIAFRIRAEPRELEAVLPLGLAVAPARVARRLREDRDDVVGERDRSRLREARHFHWHAKNVRTGLHDDLGFPLGTWRDQTS